MSFVSILFELGVHRLDRTTSGLVMLAKNVATAKHLSYQLTQHGNIQKAYVAYVFSFTFSSSGPF